MKSLFVIIPALNEERHIGATLVRLGQAVRELESGPGGPVQIIVVDNDSTDQTDALARSFGAVVVAEPIRNIARARNTGARAARQAARKVCYVSDIQVIPSPRRFDSGRCGRFCSGPIR